MLLKRVVTCLCCYGISYVVQAQEQPAYKNASLAVEVRVKDLLGRMSVEEKAGQLNQLSGGAFTGPALNEAGQQTKIQWVKEGKVGSMLNVIGVAETRAIQQIAVEQSRWGIPLLFGLDVIHGYKTIFPIPLAEACSFNLAQVQQNATVAAAEAAAAGIHWTFAPMCDISNDPRWGRVMEGIGEDPWYGALLSAARVKGFQGNLDEQHILACVKHFAGYGAVEAGREYNNTDMSRVALWNKYLPPYQAAVEAGAATVMNGFNVFEGVPVSASKYLVTDVLKSKWGFKGFLVSDWNSFGEMVQWGYAADGQDAVVKAINAGSMMDMESKINITYIPTLLKQGKITQQQLDDAVGRVLAVKFRLGLFEQPYKYNSTEREQRLIFSAAHRAEALKAARASVVLLKNNQQSLPLRKTGQQLAVIGHYANSKEDLFDFWAAMGESKNAVTLLDGMQQKWGSKAITYAAGYSADGNTTDALVQEAVAAARKADVLVVNVGITGKLAGEDRAVANPVIPEGQLRLLKALRATGKPLIAVVSAGRPLVLTALEPLADAIVYAWILGTETGNALADVLSGDYNPAGKTVMSFPVAVGQIPVYYNHTNTGRPLPTDDQGNWFSRYRDIPNEPLYPFGYGLSYTSFAYSNLSLQDTLPAKGKPVQVRVTVTNTGTRDGEEVVQLYIRDHSAGIVRPVKELKGFQKVLLKKGESRQLHFTLTEEDLSYYDANGDKQIEPGRFSVFVGGNSKEVLEAQFRKVE
ncbi:beta-glucosidase [Filimonas zeae]|uniref:beta-glucosidase n=1 Tax=Filimonas zeae TaxID=1737353 RepID=A0A917IN50_9BACT|nr:beta-glucosidase BglX [Filimonas zeae]MDR6337610.1 beta-glucosidase [Filimonas zeae]GGH59441.1 glycosyl hydrolase [Filimonas zeae]